MTFPFTANEIEHVEFFKRDGITTDLICADIRTADGTYFFHEESKEWKPLLQMLKKLPGFDSDWFSKVSQPPFAESRVIALSKH